MVGFVLVGHGIGGISALMGLLVAIVFAVIAFAPKPLLHVKFGGVDRRLAENMLRYGLPLTFNHLAIAVVDVADRSIIGSLLGVANVAPYAVAYDLVQQSIGPMMGRFEFASMLWADGLWGLACPLSLGLNFLLLIFRILFLAMITAMMPQ